MPAQPVDVYINGLYVRGSAGSPYLIHKLDACENLVGIGNQFIQKQEFLLRKHDGILPAGDCQGVIIQTGSTYHQPAFLVDIGSAHQCFYPENHFVHINGFGHIVVNT